jgi:hypothetical protein
MSNTPLTDVTVFAGAKGGQGTTTVAAAVALASAADGVATVLVDLAGDVAPTLGLPDVDPAPDLAAALHDAMSVGVGLRVVRLTADSIDTTVLDGLRSLADAGDRIVIDAGDPATAAQFDPVATFRVLVTRPCYLALRRAATIGWPFDMVVLVDEPGRCLGGADVEAVLGRPVTVVPHDPTIARTVDAGLLGSRIPHLLATALRRLATPTVDT